MRKELRLADDVLVCCTVAGVAVHFPYFQKEGADELKNESQFGNQYESP